MRVKSAKYLIVIAGPTAVGKTGFTVNLGSELNTSVINADSRQVYHELTIGTAKPGPTDLEGVVHYFIGDRTLDTDFNAGIFERESMVVLDQIFKVSSTAILSGGSGLYIKAVCEGFDEFPDVNPKIRLELKQEFESAGLEPLKNELEQKDPVFFEKVDVSNSQRIIRALEVIRTSGQPFSNFRIQAQSKRSFTTIKIGLERPRQELYDRINLRVDSMIEMGLIDEVKKLKRYRNKQALQTVGYQEIFGYLDGNYDRDEAIRLLKRNSRRYAKRQMTWFKADTNIKWFHPDEFDQVVQYINQELNVKY